MACASSNEVAMPCLGAGSPARASTRPNAPRSSARWIAAGDVPTIGHARVLEALREPERGLPAELADHAGDRAGLLSACTISSTSSRVSGSKYSRSLVS